MLSGGFDDTLWSCTYIVCYRRRYPLLWPTDKDCLLPSHQLPSDRSTNFSRKSSRAAILSLARKDAPTSVIFEAILATQKVRGYFLYAFLFPLCNCLAPLLRVMVADCHADANTLTSDAHSRPRSKRCETEPCGLVGYKNALNLFLPGLNPSDDNIGRFLSALHSRRIPWTTRLPPNL